MHDKKILDILTKDLKSKLSSNQNKNMIKDVFMHQANYVLNEATGMLQDYRHLIRGPDKALWTKALANDLGQLAQGVGTRMPKGTNSIFFIPSKAIPKDRKVTYVKLVATI